MIWHFVEKLAKCVEQKDRNRECRHFGIETFCKLQRPAPSCLLRRHLQGRFTARSSQANPLWQAKRLLCNWILRPFQVLQVLCGIKLQNPPLFSQQLRLDHEEATAGASGFAAGIKVCRSACDSRTRYSLNFAPGRS